LPVGQAGNLSDERVVMSSANPDASLLGQWLAPTQTFSGIMVGAQP
jgi:hypothetical protein